MKLSDVEVNGVTTEQMNLVDEPRFQQARKFCFMQKVGGFAEELGIPIEDIHLDQDQQVFVENLFKHFDSDELVALHTELNAEYFAERGNVKTLDMMGSIYIGLGHVSEHQKPVKCDNNEVLDIGSQKTVGVMHFIPFGGNKESQNQLDVMALGAEDMLRIATMLKDMKERGEPIPAYFAGATNKEMAEFAKSRAGFHEFKFLPNLRERFGLFRRSMARESQNVELKLSGHGQYAQEEPVLVIKDTNELIDSIPDLEKNRDRIVRLLEKRKGYSIDGARKNAI